LGHLAQRLTVPATIPAVGQVAQARTGQNYHFEVRYPRTASYSMTLDWPTKTFWIERTGGSGPTAWLWPVPGQDGADWVINNYVDLDATSAIRDYRGGSKSYGHRGVDIDISSFRNMDQGIPVLAVSAGTVVGLEEGNVDRHVACDGDWNYVTIQTDDGYSLTYGHLKQSSVSVNVGDHVEAGTTIAMVGSSGCSSWPHLHFEAYDSNGVLVDPFRDELWANVMDIMVADHPIESTDYIADPGPNVTSVQRGGWLAVGISAAGGSSTDHLVILVTQSDGSVFQSAAITMPEAARHTIWFYNWVLDASAPTGTWTVQVLVNGMVSRTHQLQVN
jgi:murein DD-endopeptidase MepM/ murein hydrolase activator NlpD